MPNGVDPTMFVPQQKDRTLLEAMVSQTATLLSALRECYVLGIGLDLLLTAVASLVKQDFKIFLLIVGDGPYRKSSRA